MIISALTLSVYLWKVYLVGRKIKDKTYQLGKDLNNGKVEDYIIFIDSLEIPPRRYHWNMIKAGYKIVKINGEVDANLIKRLKIVILSKGILVY